MLTNRSTTKELIDLGPDFFSDEEYNECLGQLFIINKLVGFFRHTVNLLTYFPKNASVIDIGCGSGLFLLHLSQYFPDMSMIGLDISPAAIAFAKAQRKQWFKKNSQLNVDFQLQSSDSLTLPANSVDIIITTLVCHHLDDETLVTFLQQTLYTARLAVIINDLHRHIIAYWFYKIVSPLYTRNRLINHDGLLSIKRGFTRIELKRLLKKAGIHHYQISWGFPFRWTIILRKKQS
jgi:SAM-dependent methyltransferase